MVAFGVSIDIMMDNKIIEKYNYIHIILLVIYLLL